MEKKENYLQIEKTSPQERAEVLKVALQTWDKETNFQTYLGDLLDFVYNGVYKSRWNVKVEETKQEIKEETNENTNETRQELWKEMKENNE